MEALRAQSLAFFQEKEEALREVGERNEKEKSKIKQEMKSIQEQVVCEMMKDFQVSRPSPPKLLTLLITNSRNGNGR